MKATREIKDVKISNVEEPVAATTQSAPQCLGKHYKCDDIKGAYTFPNDNSRKGDREVCVFEERERGGVGLGGLDHLAL